MIGPLPTKMNRSFAQGKKGRSHCVLWIFVSVTYFSAVRLLSSSWQRLDHDELYELLDVPTKTPILSSPDGIYFPSRNFSKIHVVSLRANETLMWKGRQRRLCKRIQKEEKEFFKHEKEYFKRATKSTSREAIRKASNSSQLTLFQLQHNMPCEMLHSQEQHGNFVYGLYATHVAAIAHSWTNVTFPYNSTATTPQIHYEKHLSLTCIEPLASGTILWWLQTFQSDEHITQTLLLQSIGLYFERFRTFRHRDEASLSQYVRSESCSGMGKNPLHWVSELARYHLRHMALVLVGNDSLNGSEDWPKPSALETRIQGFLSESKPPQQVLRYKDARRNLNETVAAMDLDQVAIHFRCGDVLSGLSQDVNDSYGMAPFWVYAKGIIDYVEDSTLNSLRTIGILTTPFEPNNLRPQDAPYAKPCHQLTLALQKYLEVLFPYARVSIRNDPNESIPKVFSRLVLAEVAVCLRSTFCLFPAMATFGNALLLPGGVSYFATALADAYDTVHLLGTIDNAQHSHKVETSPEGEGPSSKTSIPYLLSHEIHAMGLEKTLRWLVQTPEAIRTEFRLRLY